MASLDEVVGVLQQRLKAQEKKFPNMLLALVDMARNPKEGSTGESLSSSLGNYYASNLDRLRNNVEEFPYASPKHSDLSVIKQYFGGGHFRGRRKYAHKKHDPLVDTGNAWPFRFSGPDSTTRNRSCCSCCTKPNSEGRI